MSMITAIPPRCPTELTPIKLAHSGHVRLPRLVQPTEQTNLGWQGNGGLASQRGCLATGRWFHLPVSPAFNPVRPTPRVGAATPPPDQAQRRTTRQRRAHGRAIRDNAASGGHKQRLGGYDHAAHDGSEADPDDRRDHQPDGAGAGLDFNGLSGSPDVRNRALSGDSQRRWSGNDHQAAGQRARERSYCRWSVTATSDTHSDQGASQSASVPATAFRRPPRWHTTEPVGSSHVRPRR